MRIPRSLTLRLEPMSQATRIPQEFKAFRDQNKPIRDRFESFGRFMRRCKEPRAVLSRSGVGTSGFTRAVDSYAQHLVGIGLAP